MQVLSIDDILVFPFAYEICLRLIFLKFDSFACASHGTIFDIELCFEKLCLILACLLCGSGELCCTQHAYKSM